MIEQLLLSIVSQRKFRIEENTNFGICNNDNVQSSDVNEIESKGFQKNQVKQEKSEWNIPNIYILTKECLFCWKILTVLDKKYL